MDSSTRPSGLYVEESGTPGSHAILFLHGLGQSGREWHGHMAGLAGFHCLAPDLPGHGRSNHLPLPSNDRLIDDLAELIETRVPAGRAHVVGVSWGAFLVHLLIERHPERIERAVADGLPLVWPRWARFVFLPLMALATPFLHTRPLLALYRPTHEAADLRATSRRAWWRTWSSGLSHLTAAVEAPCPTLLTAGEKESFVRPGDAALATLMPHAEAWYATGLVHCWQRVAPDLHIRMVEAWVSGQDLPPGLQREPAPSPEMVERVRSMAPWNWYVGHKSRILWEIRLALGHYRKHLAKAYGQDGAQAIARETMQHFEALLPELPYIGGGDNSNTRDLYTSAAWLAMYRSLQARGASVEEAARFIYLGAESFVNSFPTRWLLRWEGRRFFGRKPVERSKLAAARSQKRRNPDDWVFEFVEGDGRTFEYGLDCRECGIVKYLTREGAPELAPLVCWIDYPLFAVAHVRLDRTETLAQGGQTCDFRYGRGRPVQVEQEFLHV